MRHIFIAMISCLIVSPTYSGFFELSALGSYRKNTVSSDSKTITQSATGSLAYYFFENSALEFSYTKGTYELWGRGDVGGSVVSLYQLTEFEIIQSDLVFTFAGRKAAFQPYIKAGMARRTQEIKFEQNGIRSNFDKSEGDYLSFGLGFKVLLTQTISFKFGYTSFKGPLGEDNQPSDQSYRGGLSWFF